jgi:hypothetical protein
MCGARGAECVVGSVCRVSVLLCGGGAWGQLGGGWGAIVDVSVHVHVHVRVDGHGGGCAT